MYYSVELQRCIFNKQRLTLRCCRLGEWHTSSWDSCQPEKLFQSLTNEWTTPTVGLQRRTLTCISPNTTVLAAR